MILSIEMVKNKKGKVHNLWQKQRGLSIYQRGLRNGALLRPSGNITYFMPPYEIMPDQILCLARVAEQGFDLAEL